MLEKKKFGTLNVIFAAFMCISLVALLAAACSLDGGGSESDDDITDPVFVLDTPSTPENLVAIAVSSSQVNLSWNESSDNTGVSGYKIYRDGVYLKSTDAQTVASDTGLNADTNYGYQVSAYDEDGNESCLCDTQYVTTRKDESSYTLTVIKAGMGSGSIISSPSGIDCTATDSCSFAQGTIVSLTAIPEGALSSFDSWSGADTENGNSCTVSMTSDRTVSATFAVLNTSGTYTLSLPESDSDGNYSLEWTYSGMLAKSNWRIEEDTDSSFSDPTIYTSYDNTSPYTYSFTDKPDGVYYYRVESSDWKSITVAHPATAVLRINNATHYDMVDLRLNGQQQVSYPYAVLVGDSADFTFSGSGTVSYSLGVGFYNSDGTRDVWFTLTGTAYVYAGRTSTLTFNNPSIGELLSCFSSDGEYWHGYYFDSGLGYHTAGFQFGQNGSWAFYNDGDLTGTGTVSLVSWNDYATIVSFKLHSTSDTIQVEYPFGKFLYENGPASWPVIEYTH